MRFCANIKCFTVSYVSSNIFWLVFFLLFILLCIVSFTYFSVSFFVHFTKYFFFFNFFLRFFHLQKIFISLLASLEIFSHFAVFCFALFFFFCLFVCANRMKSTKGSSQIHHTHNNKKTDFIFSWIFPFFAFHFVFWFPFVIFSVLRKSWIYCYSFASSFSNHQMLEHCLNAFLLIDSKRCIETMRTKPSESLKKQFHFLLTTFMTYSSLIWLNLNIFFLFVCFSLLSIWLNAKKTKLIVYLFVLCLFLLKFSIFFFFRSIRKSKEVENRFFVAFRFTSFIFIVVAL